jgi:hypothetical protein
VLEEREPLVDTIMSKLAALRPEKPTAPRDACGGCWLLEKVVPSGERELVAAALADRDLAPRSLSDTLRAHYDVAFSSASIEKHRKHLADA